MLMQNDLAAENARLRERIEELEFRIKEMVGEKRSSDIVNAMRDRYRLSPKATKLALFLRDGKYKTLSQCRYAIDVEYCAANNVQIHAHYIRKAGIKIKTVWGQGYQMEPESVEEIKNLIGGAVVTTA